MGPSFTPTHCLHSRNHRFGPKLICRVCGRYSPDIQAEKYEIQKKRMAARRKYDSAMKQIHDAGLDDVVPEGFGAPEND